MIIVVSGLKFRHLLSMWGLQIRFCFAGHEPVCLVPEWTRICLCLPGLFEAALIHILRAFYSANIGIDTASSCDGPTCFVPKLVAGSASISLT